MKRPVPSLMESGHLNLKWSVGAVNAVLKMARGSLSDVEIAHRFTSAGFPAAPEEIAIICRNAGVTVRRREPA